MAPGRRLSPREAGVAEQHRGSQAPEPRKGGGGWFSRETLLGATAVLVYLALVKVVLHLATANNYGYFRDELYYATASERLDFGYVDFPPLVALVTALTRATLGDSLLAFHVFPILASTGVVVLSGLIARELGGGRFAQGIAALAALVAPNVLAFGAWLAMDAFDQFFWASAAYVLILTLKKRDPTRMWLLFGLVTGLGLLTKVTMLYFGFAVFIGLVLTPARRHLLSPWPWLGGALALVFLLPYLYWQVQNGWPTPEFWDNYYGHMDPDSAWEFFVEQMITMQPFALPLWLAGLGFFLFARGGRRYRVLGLVYVLLFALFTFQNAKFYFLAGAYPMLFAGGGVVLERFFERRRLFWPRPAYAVLLAVTGAIIAPFAVLPVLPVEAVAKINGDLAGVNIGVEGSGRSQEVGRLPLNFADRLGWEEMVGEVARAYDGLPAEERAEACILARNYGEAGAIDFFGDEYGLPKAISGHNNYYIWGPRGCSGEVVISVGIPRVQLETVFDGVDKVAEVRCEYCMPDENNFPVFVSRDSKVPFEEAWPRFKHYN